MNVELHVTSKAADAVVASWHTLRVRPALLTVGVAFFVLVPWCAAVLALRAGSPTPTVVQLAVAPLAAILGFGVGIPLLGYAASRRSPTFGPVACRITNDGVTITGTGWDRTIRWSVVTDCSEWRGGVLLRSGKLAVLYVPARYVTPELVAGIRGGIRRSA